MTKLRLYIAASSDPAERSRVDAAFEALAEHYDIIGDWRQGVDLFGANPGTREAEFAHVDIEAVRDCDVFLLLIPTTQSRGAWVELGVALEARKKVVVSGDLGCSIFTSLAMSRHTDDSDALGWLAWFAKVIGGSGEEPPRTPGGER